MNPDRIIGGLPPTNRDRWVIDPARTLVLLPDFPNRQASTSLMLWLGKRFDNIQPFGKADVVAMRNTLVRDVVKKSNFDWYCMFDNDMHPTAYTDILFEVAGDIVCVQCDHGHGACWAHPSDFHCNGFRFNRAVAEKIALPWFAKRHTEDGCDIIGCSCQHFRDKALDAGFTIQRGGWMAHGTSAR